MANVKVHHNPEEKVPVEVEEKPNQITDSKGRVIKFRELNPLQESRLTCAVGAEYALNVMYMNMYVFPVASVESLDGDDCPVPVNSKQVESMLVMLGKEGMAAVNKYLRSKGEADAEKEAAAQDKAAKN